MKENNNSFAKCIHNKPPPSNLMICGNGIMEAPGENCECHGYEVECKKCCSMDNCKLISNATCFDGDTKGCCVNCKLGKKGETCRPPVNECDKPEVCSSTLKCPVDTFKGSDTKCTVISEARAGAEDNKGYCKNGVCIAGTPPAKENDSGGKWWIILLIILAAILIAVLIAWCIWCCIRKGNKNEPSATSTTGSTTRTGISTASSAKPASVVQSSVSGKRSGISNVSSATGSRSRTPSRSPSKGSLVTSKISSKR